MSVVNEGLSVDDGEDAFAAGFAEAIAGTETAPAKKEEPVVDTAAQKAADDKAAADAAALRQTERNAEADAAQKAADDKAAADAARAAETPEQKTAREAQEAVDKKAADDKAAADAAAAALAASPAVIAAETVKAMVTAQNEATAKAAAAQKAADEKAAADAAEAAKRQLTAEEIAELDGIKKEWPDMARMIELRFKENAGLAATDQGKALKAMAEHIYANIQPIAQSQKEMQETAHWSEIETRHPDYETLLPKLEPWIATQPAYLQKALKEVYTDGNAEEVNDLIQRFKDASGIVTPKADDVATAPTTTTKPVPIDPKKIAALAPVESQRSQVQDKGVDKNNFDAGWDEAMALASKK